MDRAILGSEGIKTIMGLRASVVKGCIRGLLFGKRSRKVARRVAKTRAVGRGMPRGSNGGGGRPIKVAESFLTGCNFWRGDANVIQIYGYT